MSLSRSERLAFAFFGNALLAVGWLSVGLGGLCTLAVGFFSVVGVGDSSGHVTAEDWQPAIVMLLFGGACILGGRALKRRVRAAERADGGPEA